MTTTLQGPIFRNGTRSAEDGHRDYTIKFLVYSDDPLDGPQTITFTPGLPYIGQPWTYGNDFDGGAFCTPHLRIEPIQSGQDPVKTWSIEYKFTSRPLNQCSDFEFDNPLMEPDRVSGGFVERSIKATKDRFGNIIKNIAFETVEIDEDKAFPTVRIEQNDSLLRLSTFADMVNAVNKFPLWGLPKRTIKLGNVSWERKLFGACFVFYKRVLEFHVDFRTWDRDDIPHTGTKAIRGQWKYDEATETYTWFKSNNTSVNNQLDYVAFKDQYGNPTEVFLDPVLGTPTSAPVFFNTLELRPERDFLELGIPTSF